MISYGLKKKVDDLDKKLWTAFFAGFPFIVLNGGGFSHMMDDWGHMMDWWGIPFMGFWMIAIWIVFIVIAFLVYRDAEERNMNGLLWLVLVILPWIGIVFLVIYLIIREDKGKQESPQKSAQKILDERYAKGEISREEYQKMKKDFEKRE